MEGLFFTSSSRGTLPWKYAFRTKLRRALQEEYTRFNGALKLYDTHNVSKFTMSIKLKTKIICHAAFAQ